MTSNTRRPSEVYLAPGPWETVLQALCELFSQIDPELWRRRMEQGKVIDQQGRALPVDQCYLPGEHIRYFREVEDEPKIPVLETILHVDEHLIVVDKPHFLPVMPAGVFVEETLLGRLSRQFQTLDIIPLHRLDRHTAGVVLFSRQPSSRAVYHALFRDDRIEKIYHALAPALPQHSFPQTRSSRLVRGEPFFRMQEAAGVANSHTLIDVVEKRETNWLYELRPRSGKKHQLRVHMAGLGAAICNDLYYPVLQAQQADDYSRPLKLLAKSLNFVDPISGASRQFESRLRLDDLAESEHVVHAVETGRLVGDPASGT